MTLISTSNLEEAYGLLKSSPSPKTIRSQNDVFDRAILEYGKFDTLILSLHTKKNDKPKQLDAGISPIIARIASKNKVSLALDFDDLRPLSPLEQSRALARLAFIIPMLRKASVTLKFLSTRDPRGAQALLRILGASNQQANLAS